MTISVCIATYQGERYVERQLRSILDQLGANDEIIVVDDCSQDRTVEQVERLQDPRIKLLQNNSNRREIYSFGRAIEFAAGDVIFLSDQDDVWLPGRVQLMVNELRRSNAVLITSNFEWMDESERPLDVAFDGVSATSSKRHIKNIIDIFVGKTNYFGCAMAFRRELVPTIVPIPSYVESHDLWIALAANQLGSNLHIDDKTLRKRRHGNNATSTVSNRSLLRKLWSRWIFARSMIDLSIRRLIRS
ncbi:glycosyltransferase [Bradyrhizobium sp.]|uniref:glycosyltransferase n=1 Tax=Bradyrhizobium sp. TaxID=376 RepID=UPI002734DE4B|nr:glycosyltransferase [Bradyrhizobium sp.]MDP3075374.1 glycosyltransferase [Bradyrhizobium sp.]